MQSSRSLKDTSVKFFTSEMPAAPGLNRNAGSLIDVLNACLVNGFGLQVATRFVVTDKEGVMTVPQPFAGLRMSVIEISGCADASFNGEYKLTEVSADGLRLSFPVDAPDGLVAGSSIQVKAAGAGWLKAFEDQASQQVVYRSASVKAGEHCLWLQDPAGAYARVRGYESMSAVDKGLGGFPADAQISGGGYWLKSLGAARDVRWLVVADAQRFYVAPMAGYSSNVNNLSYYMRMFGALDPLVPTDSHAVMLCSGNSGSEGGSATANNVMTFSAGTSSASYCIARSLDGMSLSSVAAIWLLGGFGTSGNDASCGPVAAGNLKRLIFAEKFVRHAASEYPRAKVPGLLHLMHTGEVTGRVTVMGHECLLFDGPNPGSGASAKYASAIDIEGPWQ